METIGPCDRRQSVRKRSMILTEARNEGVPSLREQIIERVTGEPEGAVFKASTFAQLGERPGIGGALSRLVADGRLMRICHGFYTAPVQTRFGLRPPATAKVMPSVEQLWGVTIVPSGGITANVPGLTTQVPVRPVFLTSGNPRQLRFGESTVELQPACDWLVHAPNAPAGNAVRAIEWMGHAGVEEGVAAVRERLGPEDLSELAGIQASLPEWMARPVSRIVADL